MSVLCSLASADTIIATTSNTVTSDTDFSWTITFNPTVTPAGTHLVGATLEVFTNFNDSALTLSNSAPMNETFTFLGTEQDTINSNSVDSTLVGTTTSNGGSNILLDVTITLGSGGVKSYAPLSLDETDGPVTLTDPAAYLGGDTLGGATLSGTSFTGGGGNILLDQTQMASVSGELVFDFAPNTTVPEPTSILLLGLPLAGLWLLRKRGSATNCD
jgi:hypothetical protein